MTDTLTVTAATIAEKLHLHPGGIADDQTLSDLGADSLDMVEIAMAVESELGLQDHIDIDTMETGTIAQIVAAVDGMRGK